MRHRLHRTLDFRAGTLSRDLIWRTPAGKRVQVTSLTATYQRRLLDVLAAAVQDNSPVVREAGGLVARSFGRGGLLFIFGSGHSHMLAEEAFYRAGGAAAAEQ